MIASENSSKTRPKAAAKNNKKTAKPNSAEMNALATLFNKGRLAESELLATKITQRFPQDGFGWKVLGAIQQQQGSIDKAFHALQMAAELLPNDSEAQYNLGNYFYDQGQLNEAVVCYKKSIKLAPSFANAHYNLGNVFKNQDFLGQAKESYKKALKIEPNNVQIACNLAHVLYEQELFSEAISYFEQALQRQKYFTAAHVGLGASFQAVGRLAEAEGCFRKALNSDPNDVDSHNNLGGLFKVLGRFSEAESCYRAALVIAPESSDTYIKLGSLLKDMGKGAESLFCYAKALNIDPLREDVQNDIGLALAEQGRFNEAEVCYQNALKTAPNYWKAYNNLGLSLHSMGRFTEAEAAFEKAIEFNPNEALVFSNLSLPLVAQGKIIKAEVSLKKAIEIAPAYVNAYINLGTNYLAQGLAQEAESSFFQALALEPDSTKAKSNLLFTMNYSGGHSADYRLEQACQYDRIVADKVSDVFTTWQQVSQVKRLRIGLVSGDLRLHPVAYFLENWAQHVDSSRVELIAYLTEVREDAVTHRLKPHFSGWKSLVGLCDQAAAQLIHNDSINILIDLSGHTAGNRLSVFAWKPAPVQVSWLGYFATTGMAAMDYFIADEIGVPESNKPQFVEKIKYLPDTRLCFTAPEVSMEVLPLPALANGYITFGSFQTMVKAGDDVLALWAEVMRALPNARLRWQCKSFEDTTVADDLRQRLAQFGVHSDRVTLLGNVPREAYLEAHAEVDVILDTFPFPGGTTTCEALWMGVPTLTLEGDTLIARQGASLLTAAGLGDWVAVSKAEYVSKALLLTRDLGKLANLREQLRQQVLASPLFDAPRFAKNMENALWEMWNDSQQADSTQNSLPLENNTLSNHLADDTVELLLNLNVEIISATKLSENDFWSKSALGLSLKRHLKQDARLSVKVAFENSRGLSDIFNDCIDQAGDDAILVFIHDDVWIDEANFADAVIAGLERFDVIGVAGNRRITPNHSSWAFIGPQLARDEQSNLSGRVAHGKSAFGQVSDFGEVPAECELMDGVFLAAKKSTLKQNNVQFDPQFDFHFYDLDFCRSARKVGLRLGTWLVRITHQSHGAFGSPHWREKYLLYINKWEATSFTMVINPPQHEFTERELNLQQAMNEVLQIALDYQHAGQIEEAENLYLEILDIHPKHAEANHNLGVIEAHCKGVSAALPRLEMAVQTKPENEQFWVSYIDALMQSGATDTAADALEFGQKFGLRSETAQMLAAEFVTTLEFKQTQEQINNGKRKSREHQLAHQLLDGWQGLEIGGAAHNSFGLNTRNVDYTAAMDTIFKLHELSVCGEAMPVDIVAISGDEVPLPDKSVDFVISSHVIEHFFDPIKAIKEWMRLSRKYVFIIAPLPDALPSDRGKPLTTTQELLDRHSGKIKVPKFEPDTHYSIWNSETFSEMCMQFIGDYGFHISHIEAVDTKVGNGFTVVLQHDSMVEKERDMQQAMNEVLQIALDYQNSGQIAEAENLYLEILDIHPKHAEANHNLGVIDAHCKGALAALPRLEMAVQTKPENEQFWVSYIDALMQSGATDTAADALEFGQKFGLRSETAKILATEFALELESRSMPIKENHVQTNHVKVKFKEHQLAHQLLDGLQGLEIGGSAHNSFGLDTRNVDFTADMTTDFKLSEVDMCGESLAVDIEVVSGDEVPLPNKSVDFVISSHVIEHFFDPIKAIKEWMRLSREYVFIIAPLPDALPSDRGKPLTTTQELLDRHSGKINAPDIEHRSMDTHYSIWTCETFKEMCVQFIGDYGFHISHFETVDTKVGNGFTVVLKRNSVVQCETGASTNDSKPIDTQSMLMTTDGSSLIDFFENHEHRLIHKYMHYFEIYERHFAKFRNKPLSLIEFGVYHGGSLQMWKHYFGSQAQIYGVDIDPRCASLGEENITIIMGNQEDRQSLHRITSALPKFDIIIDDGGHTMMQQIITFEEMYEHLKEGGIYLCEDLHTSYFPEYGAGLRNPNSFIEYSKRLIDQLNAWYSRESGLVVDEFSKNAFFLHYYDSIVVIEKRSMKAPNNRMRGTPSFPLNVAEQQVMNKG